MSDTQLKVTEATTGTNLGAITATDLTGAAVKIGKQHMVDDSGASYSASNRLPVDLPSGGATAANQLADNHQVTVSNQPAQPMTDTQLRANPVLVDNRPAQTMLNGQTTAATGATITLPAPPAGRFHYISVIELTLYASVAGTGGATPVSVTSTNLFGYAQLFPSARAIGTQTRHTLDSALPMKSQAAATATTIVLPAVTGGIWRYAVAYSEGV